MSKWQRTRQQYVDLGSMFAADLVRAAHRTRRREARDTLYKLLDIAACLGRLTSTRSEIEGLLDELMAFTMEDIR